MGQAGSIDELTDSLNALEMLIETQHMLLRQVEELDAKLSKIDPPKSSLETLSKARRSTRATIDRLHVARQKVLRSRPGKALKLVADQG